MNAKVLRDGTWQVVPSRELVSGDIVRVRLGDIVPADIKLISGDYVQVDESALTGESLPVSVAGHLTLFVTWLIVNDCVKRAAYNVFVHDEVIFHR